MPFPTPEGPEMTMGRLSVGACVKAVNNLHVSKAQRSFLNFALGRTRIRKTLGKRGGEVARHGIDNVLGAIVYARYVDLKREVW